MKNYSWSKDLSETLKDPDRRMFWSLIFFLAMGANYMVIGYELGAPKEACVDMVPQHHTTPQTTPFPYSITLEKNHITGGEKINVRISGTATAPTFKGFLVQARVGNISVGKFESGPQVKLLDCGDSVASGATHTSPEEKNSVLLTWTAPPGLSETIRFRATVVKDGSTFWVGHFSTPLVVKSN